MRRHQGTKVKHFDVRYVIYHKFSHGAVSYTLNGENVNVKLEYRYQTCFLYINVCQVPREMLKTEAEGRGFQQLPRDLANVNALENNV